MQLNCRQSSPRKLLVEADCPFLVFTKPESGVVIIVIIRKLIRIFVSVVSLIKEINLVILE